MNIDERVKIAEEWASALKSGMYTQCRGQLEDGLGGYCCLGVLGHIAPRVLGFHGQSKGFFGALLDESLGKTVTDVTGMRQESLSTLNDAYGLSFSSIADIIVLSARYVARDISGDLYGPTPSLDFVKERIFGYYRERASN